MHTQRQADRRQGPKDRRVELRNGLGMVDAQFTAKRVGPRERRTAQDPRSKQQWVN